MKLPSTETMNLWPSFVCFNTRTLLVKLQRICLSGLGWRSRTVKRRKQVKENLIVFCFVHKFVRKNTRQNKSLCWNAGTSPFEQQNLPRRTFSCTENFSCVRLLNDLQCKKVVLLFLYNRKIKIFKKNDLYITYILIQLHMKLGAHCSVLQRGPRTCQHGWHLPFCH